MPGFVNQEDLPIAEEDAIVEIEVAGAPVQRKIFAGTRVPAELVDVWREQTGAPESDGERRLRETAEREARDLAELEKSEADAEPGTVPESEKGDPAPARRTSRRPRT